MVGPLEASFRLDLRCDARDAAFLAGAAREIFARRREWAEDSEEDLALRFQDPRVFGEFAAGLVRSRRLSVRTRLAMADRAFDLMPLPQREAELILVHARAPGGLLGIADFLGAQDALTVLHVLHLVFAVFLDRTLLTRAPRTTRSSVLAHVLPFARGSEAACVLYAAMHLAAVPEVEARAELRRVARARAIPLLFKRSLAGVLAAEGGGTAAWVALAKQEGLLPAEADLGSPAVVAGAPRVSVRLGRSAQALLGA